MESLINYKQKTQTKHKRIKNLPPATMASPATANIDTNYAGNRFIIVYNTVLTQLNTAKSFQEHYKRGKSMTIEDLSPAVKNKTVFWNKLSELTSNMIKSVFDMSITSSHGLIDVLEYMNTEQKACAWAGKQGKFWICDIHKQHPIERSDYDRLLMFVEKLVLSNKMHTSVIARHKRAKTKTWALTHVQGLLMKAMTNDTEIAQYELAHLAAVFVWMCETKNMNLSFETQNSVAGTIVFNRSTILARKGDWKQPEVVKKVLSEESGEQEEQDHTEVLSSVMEQKEEEIPESWEDLEI